MGDGTQKKYALILNGDGASRHLENVERAIRTLAAEGPYEIAVASPEAPQQGVSLFAAPNEANLRSLISGLKAKMDDDDLLVVYVTGHGEKGTNGEGCFKFQDACLPLSFLAKQLDQVSFGRRIVVMDQCFSGGAMALFAGPKTSVVTQGASNEEVSCQLFSPYFWSAKAPDQNGDGNVSLEERYAFALGAGKTPTLTQYYSPGFPLAFSGNTDTKPAFGRNLEEVSDGTGLQEQIKRLKPGQLAMVLFSADWCEPCKDYLPQFKSFAASTGGHLLSIHAEGKKGREADWEKWGIKEIPAVAFIDREGKVTLVDKNDPFASLVKTGIHTLEDQVGFYRNRLSDPEPKHRLEAVKALGEFGEAASPALNELMPLLESRDREMVKATIATLGQMKDRGAPAVPQLLRLVKKMEQRRLNDDADLAGEAALALASIGQKGAVAIPEIARRLVLEEGGVSARLDEALNRFGFRIGAFLPELQGQLKDPDPFVRAGALIALVSFAGVVQFSAAEKEKFLGRLLVTLQDSDPLVRKHAEWQWSWLLSKRPDLAVNLEKIAAGPESKTSELAQLALETWREVKAKGRGVASPWFAGAAGLFRSDAAEVGGGLSMNFGYRLNQRWELRTQVAAAGMGNGAKDRPSDAVLGVSFQPALHFRDAGETFDPYLALPGIGLSHALEAGQTELSLLPLGFGLEWHLNDSGLSFFALANARVDFPLEKNEKPAFGMEVPVGVATHF